MDARSGTSMLSLHMSLQLPFVTKQQDPAAPAFKTLLCLHGTVTNYSDTMRMLGKSAKMDNLYATCSHLRRGDCYSVAVTT